MNNDFSHKYRLSVEDIDRLQRENLKRWEKENRNRRLKSSGFEFYQFPVAVLTDIVKVSKMTTLIVLLVLFELWFTRRNLNPVRLTSSSLQKYGISRHQKFRALKLLEKSGWILVDRPEGKNPLVTLKWLPLKDRPAR